MPESPSVHSIYLEVGKKRVFAGAVDWPGWCRRGRDEEGAIRALLAAAPRYLRALQSAELAFEAPVNISSFNVVERLDGNATTDFGAPNVPLSSDKEPVGENEMRHLQTILGCCWYAFDEVVKMAEGRDLRKGPRGGGRDLQKIVDHVLEADASYLARLGWKMAKNKDDEWREKLLRTRQAILDGLVAAAQGELPAKGPRGGIRWTPRIFVRRVAWHVMDHVWEIEDRVV